MTTKQIKKALGQFQGITRGSNCNILNYAGGRVLQSYSSIVAVKLNDGYIAFGSDYDYSQTTRKQIYNFTGLSAAQRRKAIDNGTIKVHNDLYLVVG